MSVAAADSRPEPRDSPNRVYARSLVRAFGGAILFATPLLMTMEMWELGASMDRMRLVVFVALHLLVLCGLAWFTGFEETVHGLDAALDALAAFAVAVVAAALMLALFGVLTAATPWDEAVGKVALQAAPAGFGAVIARRQLGDADEGDQNKKEREAGYLGQLFLMLAGALFFAYNVAPTEEMALIAYMIGPWRGIALALFSLASLHILVYASGLIGQEHPGCDRPFRTFLTYSLAGYGIALAVSLYALWTFGRLDGVGFEEAAAMTVVLGFPSALGAALARLVV